MRLKVKGKRGDLFATAGDERLPCVHRHWTTGIWPHHADPHADDGPVYAPYIAAIESGKRVILTNDKVGPEGKLLRDGYIAVWRVDDVRVEKGVLHFDFVERLAEL